MTAAGILLLGIACASAGPGRMPPLKVAVVPFSEKAPQRRISGEWETLLLSAGYRVIERGDVSQLLGEQGLSLHGLTDPRKAPKVGDLLGVQALLVGIPNPKAPFTVYDMAGLERLYEPQPSSVKLVDMSTGRVLWTKAGKAAGSPGSSRAGRAVDPGVERWLHKTLLKEGWDSFPKAPFKARSSGASRAAFSSHVKHRRGMRIAVHPFHSGHPEQDGPEWADRWAAALMAAGYDVLDRVHLEEILKEQKLGMTGALRPKDLTRMGSLAGVEGLVFGSIYGSPVCAFNAKLADAQSGELYWSAVGDECSADDAAGMIGSFLKEVDPE